MHVASDAVGGADFFYLLDGLDGVVEAFVVHGLQFALLEGEAQLFGALLGAVLQVGTLWQTLCRVEDFASADARAPDADVIGIFQFGKVGGKAVLVQVVDFLLAAQGHVAGQGDDFHTRRHDEEGHVEANLVVAGACRAVGNGIGAYLVGVAGDGQCLEDTLRADGDGVGAVAQHVAIDHILQALVVVFVRHVEGDILHGAQLVGVLFVGFQLLGAESARVGTGGIYFIPFLLGQIHHCERSIQSAAESDHYFFLLCFHNY